MYRFVFTFLLVASCYLLVAISPSFAQTTPATTSGATNPYTTPNTNPDVPKNLHTWTQNVMIETMAALTCQLAGIDPVNPNQKCLGVDQKTGNIGFVENGGGAIGLMGNAITMLYTPPASSGEYFRNLAGNFGIVKQASAQEQGTGFQALSPLLGVWTASRNIVYLLFIIIFVVIGIAIMLRVKIDPRTVMTVQNQIPKIIVGLVLVTFSFALAGFLIDLMYTTIYLTGNAIISTDKKESVRNSDIVVRVAQSQHPFSAVNKLGVANNTGFDKTALDKTGFALTDIAWRPAQNVGAILGKLFDNPPGRILVGFIAGFTGGQLIPKAPGLAPHATLVSVISELVVGFGAAIIAPQIMGTIMSIIVFLILVIALLFALFRLWFALLSAYVFLLLDIVFAPFWIFAGMIPGSPVSFNLWLRDVASNLSAFPTAIVMLLLGRVVMDSFSEGRAFVPPLVGGFADAKDLGALIGLGFILLTPNVVNITKAALKAPKFDTTPIRQAIGVGTGTPTSAIRNVAAGYAATHYDITGRAVAAPQRFALGFRRLVGLG